MPDSIPPLPALTGPVPAISDADRIREGLIVGVAAYLSDRDDQSLDDAFERLCQKSSAAFWIDHRDYLPQALLRLV